MATVRNADAALLRDANVELVLGQPDTTLRDSSQRIGTERLIAEARHADYWIIGDTHGQPFMDRGVLQQFKAWRDGHLFGRHGRVKPRADAYDIYEMAVLRPDWLLGDVVKMIHPDAVSRPFEILRPETGVPSPT